MKFSVEYFYNVDRKEYGDSLVNGCIKDPAIVYWEYNNCIYTLKWNKEDRPNYAYLSFDIIVLLFYPNNSIYRHPNNLVMYNLRQEIIGIIPPPKLVTTKFDEPITAIGEALYIDGQQYLPVVINYGTNELTVERHYYDIKNRVYHPDKIDIKRLPNYR